MSEYLYIAKSFQGQTEEGKLEAKNERDLAMFLKEKGLILISAKQVKQTQKRKFSLPFFNKVPLTQKLMMTRNLEVMITAGISLTKCLKTLASQTKSKTFKIALNQIEEKVLKGESFSSALQQYPKIFSNLYCSMIKVGEQTGGMDKSLEVLAFHLDRTHKLRSRIKGALMYPIVVVGAMILIGAVMLIKVVPQLSMALASLNAELPKLTKIVMGLGGFFAQRWYILLFALLVIAGLFLFIKRKEKGKRVLAKIVLKIPFVSGLIKKINTAYTARTLGSLISGGVAIVEALEIAADSLNNYFYTKSLKYTAQQVKKGKKISESMAEFSNLYSPLFVQMLQVGEETGRTSEILGKLADFLEEEVTNTTQNLSAIIEPILLLVIGGVIAFFAVAMMQPMYSMMSSL